MDDTETIWGRRQSPRWRETNDQNNVEIGHAKEELVDCRVGRNERRRNTKRKREAYANKFSYYFKKGIEREKREKRREKKKKLSCVSHKCVYVCQRFVCACVCNAEREIYSQKAGGGNRTERERERESRREGERTPSAKGWKTGNPVTMRPAGGWGLLDLFEDQEEDVEEAQETQTVVGRENDGFRPARAR